MKSRYVKIKGVISPLFFFVVDDTEALIVTIDIFFYCV